MINKSSSMKAETRENMRGGTGCIDMLHLLEQETLSPKARLCAKLTIPPKSSIGEHTHGPDAEIYIITKGKLTVSDEGVKHSLEAGDVMYTSNGEAHSVINESDEVAEMIAIVLE